MHAIRVFAPTGALRRDPTLVVGLQALAARGARVTAVLVGPHEGPLPDTRGVAWTHCTAERLDTHVTPDHVLHAHGARFGLRELAPAAERAGLRFGVTMLPGECADGALSRLLRDLPDACRVVVVPTRFHHAFAHDRGLQEARLALLPPPVRVEPLILTAPPPPSTLRRVAILRARDALPARDLLARAVALVHAAAPDVVFDDEGAAWPPSGAQPRADDRLDRIARADVVIDADALGDGAFDAFPASLVEAAALRRPVLAARLPALEDLVVDGVNGLLFPAGDAAALAAAVLRLAARSGELQRLGEGGPPLAAAHEAGLYAARFLAEVAA
jgi:glycosyltransferase involved in cell wall biosynthesis